jgi:DNA-binding CsgD family transcriptional regulator
LWMSASARETLGDAEGQLSARLAEHLSGTRPGEQLVIKTPGAYVYVTWSLVRESPHTSVHYLAIDLRGTKVAASAELTLTPAEQALYALLLAGKSYAEMAEEKFVSRTTVKTHVRHILRKLGASSRVALLAKLRAP